MIHCIKSIIKYSLIGGIILLLNACSTTFIKNTENISDAELYRSGFNDIKNNNYYKAIDKLKTLESHYPFGTFSTQGQLLLIYAYLNGNDAENAHAVANRFIRLHPDHANVDYAYYMLGISSWYSWQSFAEKYLPIDITERDSSEQLKSFNEFSDFLAKFPNSKYAQDARLRMTATKWQMANHILHIANYYMERQAYIASINRANEIITNFEKTPQVEHALGMLVINYQKLKLQKQSTTALKILKLNYPKSNLLDKNGDFISSNIENKNVPSYKDFINQESLDKIKSPMPPKYSN